MRLTGSSVAKRVEGLRTSPWRTQLSPLGDYSNYPLHRRVQGIERVKRPPQRRSAKLYVSRSRPSRSAYAELSLRGSRPATATRPQAANAIKAMLDARRRALGLRVSHAARGHAGRDLARCCAGSRPACRLLSAPWNRRGTQGGTVRLIHRPDAARRL